jgi:hypothetical protein
MAFTTAFLKIVHERLRYALVCCCHAFLPFLAWPLKSRFANPQITAERRWLRRFCRFRFELTPRLEEAVTKGVVLYFVLDFEMTGRAGTGWMKSWSAAARPISLSLPRLDPPISPVDRRPAPVLSIPCPSTCVFSRACVTGW